MFVLSGARLVRALVATVAMLSVAGISAHAKGSPPPSGPTETIIHTFSGLTNQDAASPQAGLIYSGGNFYGVTNSGGSFANHQSSGDGTVYMITPSGTETILHNFGNGLDGWNPWISYLRFDSLGSGTIFGTTKRGGAHDSGSDGGTVFELVPNGASYTETIIHDFDPANFDGGSPIGGLVQDASGNLFGAADSGGAFGHGTIFELSNSGGVWTYVDIHDFSGAPDGAGPRGLVYDPGSGNLYGTTPSGGASLCGTVFQLAPGGSGGWIESVIHSFACTEGDGVFGAPTVDGAGALYGTAAEYLTATGAINQGGSVWKLTNSGGTWAETTLYLFGSSRKSVGCGLPMDRVSLDAGGDVYGTCSGGGFGSVFKLVKPATGSTWTASTLLSFAGGSDGRSPNSSISFDSTGKLYGTTITGGASNAGTVFKISNLGL